MGILLFKNWQLSEPGLEPWNKNNTPKIMLLQVKSLSVETNKF